MTTKPAELGVGTATLSAGYGLGQDSEVTPGERLLQSAIDEGVTYIDTAPAYGHAETTVGNLHKLMRHRNVRVCTKVDGKNGTAALHSSLTTSIQRLHGIELDTLLLHSASQEILTSGHAVEFLMEARQKQKTRRIGVSTYGREDALAALRSDWLDVVQVEFSILNQSVLPALLPDKRPGQEVVLRSVLCKGLLSPRRTVLSDLPAPVVRALDELDRLSAQWGFTLTELAIRFAVDAQGADVALIGMTNLDELKTARRAYAHAPLESDQINTLLDFDLSRFDCVHPERWS